MTQISDERLKAIASGHELHGNLEHLNIKECEITQMASELLSARETIRRLVENSKALYRAVISSGAPNALSDEDFLSRMEETKAAIEAHTALLAELEGKGFETAMKRVVGENIGAWKALGGEEGKG